MSLEELKVGTPEQGQSQLQKLEEKGFKGLSSHIKNWINEQNEQFAVIPLPSDKADGDVQKCSLTGNVTTIGYEIGMLYLKPGSGIKEHTHVTDIEKYMAAQESNFKYGGEEYSNQTCLKDGKHGIDVEDTPRVIVNIKIAEGMEDLIDINEINIDNIFSPKIQEKLNKVQERFEQQKEKNEIGQQ